MTGNFPSPPAIAQQVLALASEAEPDMARLASTITKDPGLTAKLLRVANSPIYSKQRKSQNVRQAIVVLGINASITLALSFSLLGTYKNGKNASIDHSRFWRRAILGASAGRLFAMLVRSPARDDVFLAGLLRDLAVIAIDRVQPDFYAALPPTASHGDMVAHEKSVLGLDHAALGGSLLRQWKLPENLCATIDASHDPTAVAPADAVLTSARCVALGGECAEILMGNVTSPAMKELAAHAHQWLGLSSEDLNSAIERLVGETPETERLFETALIEPELADSLVDQARDLLLTRNLSSLSQVSSLQQQSTRLQARTIALENERRRDPLTGAFNRGHLDEFLKQEFAGASGGGWPLSLVFVDLDKFKHVNDTYGHPVGDQVLIATVRMMQSGVRSSDCVARYGGEEFVIVLPGIDATMARKICDRLLMRLREARHAVAGNFIRSTASIGLATHCPQTLFPDPDALLSAADRSVYAAKAAGRDRLIQFAA